MNETVIITGASGFIGSYLTARLAKHYNVIGLDRRDPPTLLRSVTHLDFDLASEESVQDAFRQVRKRFGDKIASVIHLASYHDFSGESHPLYDEVNVRGTRRLLRELKNFRVGQFIFSSTLLVHAPCEPGQVMSENWPFFPKWAYPESKFKAEEVIRSKHGSIPYVLLRIGAVYDRLCRSAPLARQMQRIFERKWSRAFFPGHLSHGQAFLHVDDLVSAVELLILRRDEVPAELTLFLAEPQTFSYDEIQHRLARLIHGEKLYTHQIPKSLAKAAAWIKGLWPFGPESFVKPWMIDIADDHYAVDTGRASKLLHWEPKRSLRGSLPEMIGVFKTDLREWYRANGLEMPARIRKRSGMERRRRPGRLYPGQTEHRREKDRRLENPEE